ncbi:MULTISPECIES: aldehyde dehydrogenase family protein [unclassified Sphingobium]|uniref:aldehyde dehydrogenase family protein n=1 Tax=unclassified Sphingobium TaxID=2611147 RepID=UPI000D15796B|nr:MULTISPECIES: aldehyde dehydrogenase family protein [unclassified Sphingobium]MBG6117397.1 acyl-CoA reductase-like NAD-dependent aldehyde dehydrogenase [Sphingobium sp. JAI105]PSO09543.1 aldehyde dehydrogenase [Sphingobium sp. AEW4]TWC96224.1 acyl-CoA reductase-like NAD-dependent aldehyde dehydrogenase [Sphingobium sp. AEW010]TWD15417.1 acyl-CoA reductase-like NAD-dependent aldehyde dehydrogenase [Sphingobium sp. AEW013]TWD19191.1 acyl-CoA reductase-like NAD-dependent aldehyde dehydrogenase
MAEYKLLIDGRLVDGAAVMDVLNPATEEVLARCPRASAQQLDEAVAAAQAAFPAWSRTSIAARRALILKFADSIEVHAEELARLLTQEQGKPLSEAGAEIGYSVAFIRQLASYDLPVQVLEDNDTRRVELHRRPLGVVGAIIPWNFPILIVAFKLPFALLAGNTLVVKPAPTTPLSTLRLGELMAAIFPAGAVNIITDQNDLGTQLTTHPGIAKISFTGSTETGRKVMASAAASIKRLTLELGGNDAAIVLADADPIKVAPGIFSGAFMNAGQICLAIKRVYAHSDIYDALCAELARLAEEAVVDDGLKQGAQIGPLQNKAQYEKVKALVESARADGTIIAGGKVLDRPGYFVRPTIVRDISDGAHLVDEEQFGPVLPIIRFDDSEDALARANASDMGLGGSIWSADRQRAHDLAMRMEAGTVWINKHLDFGPTMPFGGAKQSGLGVEFAQEGLHEFTQIHVINEAKA